MNAGERLGGGRRFRSHVGPRFSDNGAGMKFRTECRNAITKGILTKEALQTWKNAYKARRQNIQQGTKAARRADILREESDAYSAILAALQPDAEQHARLASVQATGEDTN